MTAKTRKAVKAISIILVVILVITGGIFGFIKLGEARLREQLSLMDDQLSSEDAYGDSGEIYHNGQGYVYNENLINILCIGVDKDNKANKNYRQADALYLMSLDTKTNNLNILAISRNILAEIDIYDMNNEFLDTDRAQICLSFVYGKDDEHSSMLTTKAVSKLLYDLPINSYYTIFMNGISQIVDSVGDVRVTVPEDMTDSNAAWSKGSTVVLNGSNALKYLRHRKESNEPRMDRHIGFIKSFISSAKSAFAKDISLPVDLYKKVAKNSVTNIDASQVAYLATEISKANVNLYSLKGQVGFDGMYETFEADEEALYETVLNLFYIKTN